MPGLPAARNTDPHVCTSPFANGITGAHAGGIISASGSGKVFINGLPAAVVNDTCNCPTDTMAQNFIAQGSATVSFGGKAAARQMDPGAHPGSFIQTGSPNVNIGG